MLNASWFRFSRKWHRWGAWALSAFVLMWTVTGVVMIWPAGGGASRDGAGAPVGGLTLTDSLIPPVAALRALPGASDGVVRGLSLRSVDGELYWAFTLPRGTRLVDARTGILFEMSDSTAVRLARERMKSTAEVSEVSRLTRPDERYRGPLPAWRVRFRDVGSMAHVTGDGATSLAESGFRWKNAAGMLHAFNVPAITSGRPRLRMGLLIIASAGTLALIVTGLVLLLPIRRSDG